ncbi:MAG: metallo-mystery pair system four-Cys motif protein [Myxococcales bacterium]|nr:metallo-mystery pair system four-Cys motif protein [Myxococcales bacterium]
MRTKALIIPSLTLAAGLAACGGTDEPNNTNNNNTGTQTQAVTLKFAAQVAGADFVCGQTYAGLGTRSSTLTANDFRFYVSEVALVDAAGNAAPVTLTQDGKWQYEDVALLDFEDGCGGAGNIDLRSTVEGEVAAGDYTGVRFTLGVPFDKNHQEAATAPAPLNLTAMFWNWNGGYKFLRVDGGAAGIPGWRLHLGSTTCDGDGAGHVSTCGEPNRPVVTLSSFDAATDTIVMDLAEVVADVDLTNDTTGSPGCMSAPNDMECAGYFKALGLPFGAQAAVEQTAFMVK